MIALNEHDITDTKSGKVVVCRVGGASDAGMELLIRTRHDPAPTDKSQAFESFAVLRS